MSNSPLALKAPKMIRLALLISAAVALIVAIVVSQPYLPLSKQTALEKVQESGVLMISGTSGPTTFVAHNGQSRGFQYELARLFAEELGVKLILTDAGHPEKAITNIKKDDADIAITGMTSDDPRLEHVRTTKPYLEVSQQLVYRHEDAQPTQFDDIQNATIAAAAGSAAAQTLRQLARYRPDLHILEVPQTTPSALLDMVDSDKVDFVALNSQEFGARRALFPDLGVALNLQENATLSWAFVKNQDHSLYDAAQAFLNRVENDGTLDRLASFYGQGKTFDGIGVRVFQRDIAKRLPRYQNLFQEHAKKNNMDWLLLAAIAYQESKWEPNAVSPTGVRGIMMLTRDTAAYMNVADRVNPSQSIRGGAGYYRQMSERLPEDIREPDRTWMALASYNMGPGYIDRARKNTAAAGDDPTKWLDVSRHLREMANDARRKGRTVPPAGQALVYVQEVRRYYDALLMAQNGTETTERVAMNNTPSILVN